jgi:uncharacterized membrane protein
MPTTPRSGFGFLPFLLPFLWWGGGSGASAGARGGFGFGGILGLLIILGIVVVVGRVLLKNLATARRNRLDGSPSGMLGGERYAVVKCQLALLSTARSLQRELQTYANTGSTDTVTGLASALQDVVMALMRHSDYWRNGVVQVQAAATLDDAERAFNQVVSQERTKLSGRVDSECRWCAAPSSTVRRSSVQRGGTISGRDADRSHRLSRVTAYQTPSPKISKAPCNASVPCSLPTSWLLR